MVTGYEVSMYNDISRIADSLSRIALALEQLVEHRDPKDPPEPTEARDPQGPPGIPII